MTYVAEKKKSDRTMQHKPDNKLKGLATMQTGTVQLYAAAEAVVMYNPALPAERKEFIIAHKSPRIHELPALDVDLELNRILERMYVEIGDKATSTEDKSTLMRMFVTEVRKKFNHLSLADISNALSMGVRGEFSRKLYSNIANKDGGTFIDKQEVSLVVLIAWIQSYMKHQDRAETVFNQTKFEQDIKIKESEEARRQQWRAVWGKHVLEFCHNYKQSLATGVNAFAGQPIQKACPWFEYFEKNGMLTMTVEEKVQMWPRAKNAALGYYEELRSKNSNPTIVAKISMIAQIPAEFEKVAAFKKDMQEKDAIKAEIIPHCIEDIKQEAKRISFDDFIKKSLENKVDLNAKIIEIEEKKNKLKITV